MTFELFDKLSITIYLWLINERLFFFFTGIIAPDFCVLSFDWSLLLQMNSHLVQTLQSGISKGRPQYGATVVLTRDKNIKAHSSTGSSDTRFCECVLAPDPNVCWHGDSGAGVCKADNCTVLGRERCETSAIIMVSLEPVVSVLM